MKCPICNGKGTQFISDFDGMYEIVCAKCKGKGELDENGQPIMTNEEWLRSCSTEELAEWIYRSKHGYWGDYLGEEERLAIDHYKWWLQEKHQCVNADTDK